MRLHRFFVTKPLSGEKEVVVRDLPLHHQLKNVFRFQVGAKVILLDNSGYEFEAVITSFELNNLHFEIMNSKKSENIPAREITLFQSLIKKDNFEWILEKGTELGIANFVPVLSERSEKKSLNYERAEKIVKEASEQSGRGILPKISSVIKLEQALGSASGEILAFDPTGISFESSKLQAECYNLFIGPEGGWSDRELELFKKNKVKIYSLGAQILRAETAAIAVSALLLL